MEDIALKLAEAKAKREKLESDRVAKAKAEAEKLALEHELREIANLEALNKAEEEHGENRIEVLNVPDGRTVILRAPKGIEYKRYLDSKGKGHEDARALVARLVVHPSADEYKAIVEEYPALFLSGTLAMQRLAGFEAEAQAKK